MLVLVAFAAFTWVETDPTGARESLCEQAEVLEQAGLLNKARDTYASAEAEGERCGGTGRGAVEAEQRRADAHFEEARLYSAARPAEPTAEARKAAADPGASNDSKAAIDAVDARREALTRVAIAEYLAGLAINPFEESARLGIEAELKTLLAPSAFDAPTYFCRLSAELVRASLLDSAAATLASGVGGAPQACALPAQTLRLRRQLANASLREAQRHDAAGETVLAREWLVQALRANAGLGDARTALEDSIEEESALDAVGAKLAELPETAKAVLTWLVPLAVALLLLALLGWIVVRELAARSRQGRAALEAMSRARPLGFLRKATVPTLTVGDFDGADAAKDFSKLLEVGLPKESSREPAFAFDRVTNGSADDAAAADAAAVLTEIPQTKLLGSLVKTLGHLFRRPAIQLQGHLQPAGDRGAGVTLTLAGTGMSGDASITLWEESFDPEPSEGDEEADRWLRLVPAATIWVRWQLAAAQLPPGEKPPEPDAWKADAYFASGVAHQATGDRARAETLYVTALEQDPSLRPAAHNLAVIEIRQGRYAEAETRLRELRKALAPGDRERWPTLETGSRYSLALALCYPALESEAPTPAERAKLGEALEEIEALVKQLALPASKLSEDPATRAALRNALAPTVVALASLEVRHQPGLAAEAVRRATRGAKAKRVRRRDLRTGLAQQQPADLVDGFVRRRKNISRRSHYNLACYYTTLSRHCTGALREQCLDLALESLRKALVGRTLSSWAGRDPSLQPLLDARSHLIEGLPLTAKPHPRRKRPEPPPAAPVTSAP